MTATSKTSVQRRRQVLSQLHLPQLELKSISGTEWLVYDQNEHRRTGIGIVGFIESLPSGFQVLAFSELSRRMQFESFDRALDFVALHCPPTPAR